METIMCKIIPLSLLFTLTLTACGESIKTKEELSKLSLEEFAVNACNAFQGQNLEQLEHMVDDNFSLLQSLEKQFKHEEFEDFIDEVDCSSPKVVSQEEKNKVHARADFEDQPRFKISFVKENGFYKLNN